MRASRKASPERLTFRPPVGRPQCVSRTNTCFCSGRFMNSAFAISESAFRFLTPERLLWYPVKAPGTLLLHCFGYGSRFSCPVRRASYYHNSQRRRSKAFRTPAATPRRAGSGGRRQSLAATPDGTGTPTVRLSPRDRRPTIRLSPRDSLSLNPTQSPTLSHTH